MPLFFADDQREFNGEGRRSPAAPLGFGFTLIELMIVVAIIAILALIAVPQYNRYVARSRNAAVQSLLQQLMLSEIALFSAPEDNQFALVNGQTPADLAALGRLMSYGFRPDPLVGFAVIELTGAGGGENGGIIAFAAYKALGYPLFVYDNVIRNGAQPLSAGTAFPPGYGGKLFIYGLDDSGVANLDGWLEATDNLVTAIGP